MGRFDVFDDVRFSDVFQIEAFCMIDVFPDVDVYVVVVRSPELVFGCFVEVVPVATLYLIEG